MNRDEENIDEKRFEHYHFIADPKQELIRIDKFLLDRLPNVSRNQIQLGIKENLVSVNDAIVKANYKIHPSDSVKVYLKVPPRIDTIEPENIPLDIVYEDESVLVVNKPAQMVVHPAHNNWSGTLVNALVYHYQNLPQMSGNIGRPGLVHRIDKDTSGLLVVAKTDNALTFLARQFQNHTIERTYLALVWGEPVDNKGTLSVNVGRSVKDRRIVTCYPTEDQGKKAITHYEVLEYLRYVSLVKCNLETGRTHQIRAHMKYLGHPLFNDTPYGGSQIKKGVIFPKYKKFVSNCFETLSRQALHAQTLGFIHPQTQKWVQFSTPLPDDFDTVLNKWRNYVTKE